MVHGVYWSHNVKQGHNQIRTVNDIQNDIATECVITIYTFDHTHTQHIVRTCPNKPTVKANLGETKLQGSGGRETKITNVTYQKDFSRSGGYQVSSCYDSDLESLMIHGVKKPDHMILSLPGIGGRFWSSLPS